MTDEIQRIKAEVFDILRMQEDLMTKYNALNTQKNGLLNQLEKLQSELKKPNE